MRVSDFDFELPKDSIAQTPAEPRDAARLLVHRITRASTEDRTVRELTDCLEPGDLLVLNDARVLPARVFAKRATGANVELLLIEAVGQTQAGSLWRSLVRPARKLKPGESLDVQGSSLIVRAIEREADEHDAPSAIWTLSLELGAPSGADVTRDIEAEIERSGRMPLPPYIRREREGDERDALDRERYQTVYAKRSGAVAAPTAGLHFTPELLERLAAMGVRTATVSLLVGLGTFVPVTAEDTRDHAMHEERFTLTPQAVRAIHDCRERGGRVIAVGTTSVRVLESCASTDGGLEAREGSTALFIEPGYRFQVVDGLITNFHLPKSTLLMLVSALAGRERTLELYRRAVETGYRFYSYGDAMLLLP